MRVFIAAIVTLATVVQAFAEYSEEDKMISSLAQIIIAENLCEFKYDQQAIADYIAKNVAHDNKTFYDRLSLRVKMMKDYDLPKMQETSAKVILCMHAHDMATALGFIKKK